MFPANSTRSLNYLHYFFFFCEGAVERDESKHARTTFSLPFFHANLSPSPLSLFRGYTITRSRRDSLGRALKPITSGSFLFFFFLSFFSFNTTEESLISSRFAKTVTGGWSVGWFRRVRAFLRQSTFARLGSSRI